MKQSHTKNIKVNIYVRDFLSEDKDKKIRTSTTLNYQICDFYFSSCLYPEEARKLTKSKARNSLAKYRKWLIGKVQEWANSQSVAISSHLEEKLLREIYAHGFEKGLDKNRENLGLDV